VPLEVPEVLIFIRGAAGCTERAGGVIALDREIVAPEAVGRCVCAGEAAGVIVCRAGAVAGWD